MNAVDGKNPGRASGGTEFVALASAVGAALCVVLIILTLIRQLKAQERLVMLSSELVAGVLLGTLSWGIFTLKRWAWIISLIVCTALSLLLLSGALILLITLITEGFGRPHGVTAVGQAVLCFLLPLGLFIFGSPVLILWRDRSSFRNGN